MTTTRRAWPFAGDSPVVRARKMALAYRHTATELQTQLHQALDIIAKMDPRIVGWVDAEEFQQLHQQATGTDRDDCIREMDQRFYEWGEQWHASFVRAYDDEEQINTDEAAGILMVAGNTVSRLRMRGKIAGKFIKEPGDHTGRWYYKAADVYQLSLKRRPRGSQDSQSTDRVQDADEVTPHD